MNIPFYPNTGDGTHCWQAVIMMALAALWPQHRFTYEDLNKISGKEPGKWTWPTQTMIWLIDNGFDIKLIETFDYERFSREGIRYIEEKYGPEVARVQEQMSDIKKQQGIAAKFATLGRQERRLPTRKDIETLLRQDYVLICNINAALLYGLGGYSGHFVVITGYNNNDVILHDPGLPPNPNAKIPWGHFENAWAFPTDESKNLLAIGKGLTKKDDK